MSTRLTCELIYDVSIAGRVGPVVSWLEDN